MTIVKCIKSQIYYTNVDLLISCCLKINCHTTQAACFRVCKKGKVKMDFHMIKFLFAARFAMRMRKDFLLDFLERNFRWREFSVEHKWSSAHRIMFLCCDRSAIFTAVHSVIQTVKDFYDRRDHFLNESSLTFLTKPDNLTWQVVIKLSVKRFHSTAKWEKKMFDDDLLENCHTCSHWSSQKRSLKYSFTSSKRKEIFPL